MADFFSRFRASHRSHFVLPAFLALGISFLAVAQMRGTPIDMKNLAANVAGGLEQKVNYGADLVMERSGSLLTFRIGKDALGVKSLYFSLIGNPSVFSKVESTDSKTTVTMNEPGVTLVRVAANSSLHAGDVITTLTPTLSGESPLTLIDAGFSSESGEYSLSVKGE